jgi:hypothetical protein
VTDLRHLTDAELAKETAVVQRFYYYMPPERKKAARDELRRATQYDAYRKEDGMADVLLEQLWNILADT